MNKNNVSKCLAGVVSLEAWHDNFINNNEAVNLYTDVVFRTERVGGHNNSPVKFRLSIKKAEVVIIISETEQVKVKLSTVARCENDIEQIIQKNIPTISVLQSKSPEGGYRWELTPKNSKVLVGKPWNPVKKPRLQLQQNNNCTNSIAPGVLIEVRCLREDLDIQSLELTDENLFEKCRSRAGVKNNEAAAISYIRDQLIKEGLDFGDLENSFGHITIASTIAISS